MSKKWFEYTKRLAYTAGKSRLMIPVANGIYHPITSRDIPVFPHDLRGYPDYPHTAKRNYRPTIAW